VRGRPWDRALAALDWFEARFRSEEQIAAPATSGELNDVPEELGVRPAGVSADDVFARGGNPNVRRAIV